MGREPPDMPRLTHFGFLRKAVCPAPPPGWPWTHLHISSIPGAAPDALAGVPLQKLQDKGRGRGAGTEVCSCVPTFPGAGWGRGKKGGGWRGRERRPLGCGLHLLMPPDPEVWPLPHKPSAEALGCRHHPWCFLGDPAPHPGPPGRVCGPAHTLRTRGRSAATGSVLSLGSRPGCPRPASSTPKARTQAGVARPRAGGTHLFDEVPGVRGEVRGQRQLPFDDLVHGFLPVLSSEGRLEEAGG